MQSEKMYIPVILGTARKGRNSEKAAKFMLGEVLAAGLESEIIDVRDFRIGATDNTQEIPEAKRLEKKISRADGFVIVAPEYNHGYPGELKMMLDMLYSQYAQKPVGFCGVSAGPLGGARCVEQLREVSVEFHMVPIREAMYFPLVQSLFDEKGEIKNPDYKKFAKTFLEELKWYARVLKPARANA